MLGAAIILGVSWCFASVTILTRKMQKLSFAVVLFYQSCLALPVMTMLIFGESWAKAQPLHLTSYSMTQWGWMVMIGTINLIGLATITISMQNERSGFITLIGYVGLVYSFVGDWLVFKEQLYWL